MPIKSEKSSNDVPSKLLIDQTGELIIPGSNNKSSEAKSSSSYFDTRTKLLGITPKINSIGLHQTDLKTGKDIIVDLPIFSQVPEGIKIRVYTIDRYQIRTSPKETIDENGKGTFRESRWKKDYAIIRLEKPEIKKDGSVMKYRLPKGAGTYPFFPPALVEKYDKKEPIDTLYMVEGYFKAVKASMHDCDIVGLSSITHMKNKDTGKLHSDIELLIKTCGVKRVVWLTDGDAIDITQKELTDGLDLSKRPKGFFTSVSTFKTCFDDYEELEKWFFHIDTDNILSANSGKLREDVKGIDDLLISFPKKSKEIISDLKSFTPGPYFQKFNVTYGTNKAYNHFHLRDVKDFYLFHVERRPELKGKEFVFNGTRYQYNEETGECDVKIPGAAKLYFRCGDDFFKFVNIPNQYQQLERTFNSRKKTTITDDHGPKFIKYIPKYEAFCNVPNHFNYQQVIHNCFNVYSPLDFEPDETDCSEEDCPSIINLVKHVFGDNIVSYYDKETKEKKEYKTYEMGLDYLQLLYQMPQQKLPILCLVSHENNTGKTTFGNFLRMMLGANTAIVGNADLQSDFNAHWATKSVVVCDETKIDKDNVVAKIKNLSTARKIFMNAKGRGQVELDCFIKFVLITNNEDSFIHATDDDIRYWVIKVPVLKQENPTILDLLKEEMPAFLSFINKRKLATKLENRMWFHPDLIKTEALKRVIEKGKPGLEKEISYFLRDLFISTEEDELFMSCKNIIEVMKINTSKWGAPYVEKILKEDLKLAVCHKFKIDVDRTSKYYESFKDRKYKTKNEAIVAANKIYPGLTSDQILDKIKTINVSKSYQYYYLNENGKIDKKWDNGKAYILKKEKFVKPEDEMEKDDENDNDDMADDQPF